MNKHERQGREPADQTTLPDDIGNELSRITTEVIDVSDAPPIAPPAPLTQDEVRTILMSLLLTMFLAALDQTIVATALPTIGRQFNDVSNLSWVITAYLLASTAVAPVFGTLSDIYGRRAMITVSLVLFTAGSILCAVAPNMPVLIVARGLQGLGGGGIMPVVQTVISDVVSPRERGRYQAYFSGVWMAAGIAGPGPRRRVCRASALVDDFLDQRAAGRRRAVLVAAQDGQDPGVSPPAQGRLARRRAVDGVRCRDHAGAELGRQPLCLAVACHHGDDRGICALALAFVWHARNADEPFLPLPLMGGTVVPYAMVAGGCALGAITGLTVHLPLYYEVVYHLSASEAGLALIPLAAVSTCGAAIAGRTMARAKHYKRVAIVGHVGGGDLRRWC